MIKSRCRFHKVKADSKRLIMRQIRPRYGIALAMLFSMMFMAPAIVAAADAASSARWSDEDLIIVRHPSTGAVKFLRSKQGLDSGVDKSFLRKKPKRAARTFLRRYLSLLGMPKADRELVLKRKFKGAIADVLAGREGVIYNTDKIVAFLGDYAKKSPPGVKFFANMVKLAILKHKKQNKLFLGFRLE